MPRIAERTKETSTTTGTGALDLDGPPDGFQGFVAAVGDGAEVYYAIVQQDPSTADEWERGVGTVTDAATDTLSRDTVLESTNGGSLVSFSAGTKDVFVAPLSSRPGALDFLAEIDRDSPVAHLRLGETSGTTAADRTGNGNTGTYGGSPTLDADGAIVDESDGAVSLDGSNDYIEWDSIVGDLATLTAFTIEGWFKSDNDTKSDEGLGRVLFAANTSGGGNRWVVRINAQTDGTTSRGEIHFHDIIAGKSIDVPLAFHRLVWHHVALVYQSGIIHLYLDGQYRGGYFHASNVEIASDDLFSVGQEWDSSTESDHFLGDVDEVVAYDKALGPDRILAHYRAGRGV